MSYLTTSTQQHQHSPGQSSLPEACPICQHSPLNAEDAKPSKSLRLTVAQFLKSIKKKREKVQTASGGDVTPAQTAEPSTPVVDAIPAAAVDATLEPSESLNASVESAETPVPHDQQADYNPKQEVEATAERVAEEDAELHELEATAAVTRPNQVRSTLTFAPVTTLTQEQTALDQGAKTAEDENEDEDAESDTSYIEIFTGDEDKTAANPWGETEEEEYVEGDQQWGNQDGQNQMGGQGFGYQGDQGDMSTMYPNMNPQDMMQMMMQQMGNMNGNWPNMMGEFEHSDEGMNMSND